METLSGWGYVDCDVLASSHGRIYATTHAERNYSSSRKENFHSYFPKFKAIYFWPGLTLLDDYAREGFKKLLKKGKGHQADKEHFEAIFRNSMAKMVLLIIGSNDYKSFITKNGRILRCSKKDRKRWQSLEASKKINFQPRDHRKFLIDSDINHIKENVKVFFEYLISLVKNSRKTTVFLSSLLERVYKVNHPNLDLLFAYINHFLFEEVKKNTEICNAIGGKVNFVFINVACQFYNAENPVSLAIDREKGRGELTHRNKTAMRELAGTYGSHILKNV